jgi:hypothetical protein
MGVLTKYDQIEPIYLPQSVVTYISLHPVYRFLYSKTFNEELKCDTGFRIVQAHFVMNKT